MAGNSKKPKVFADFSIATLLRKDDESRPGSRSSWGDLKQPNILSTEIQDNYYNYGLRLPSPSYGCSLEATNSQEEDELISVCGDYNEDIAGNRECHEDSSADSTFAWLTCTRFKPPKLPRPRRKSASKRNGRGPRIPFSTHQLSVLENTFVGSQYLSSEAITNLAESLNLTETRVKIWFQNRRARFRREKELPLEMNSTTASRSCTPNSSFQDSSQHQTSHRSSCQSFRHLINDLNLMAASNITGVNASSKCLLFNQLDSTSIV